MIHIGFTGTQNGMSEYQKNNLHKLLSNYQGYFHHGDCIGADKEAFEIAYLLNYKIVSHPPSNPNKRAFTQFDELRPTKPYLDRNHDIINECSLIIAAPRKAEQLRSGTWATIRYARKYPYKELIILSREER